MKLHSNACVLPWMSAAIDVRDDILPCCRFRTQDYTPPKASDGLNQALNSEMFNNIRNRMMAGEKLSNCFKCHDEELASGHSMRTEFNEDFNIDATGNIKLRYLEVGFSTHCNLACRMCSDEYSSKWASILNKGTKIELGFDMDMKSFNVPLENLSVIKIIGGEPLLAKQHDQFIEKLLDTHNNLQNLKIIYHTNGTILPSRKVLDFWKKCKQIAVYFSIDGVGKMNEYQRPGHKWETIVNNVEYYKSIKDCNLKFGIQTTITSLNIMKLHHIYDWLSSTFNSGTRMSIDTAVFPKTLAIRNLPDDEKSKAIEYIQNNIEHKSHKKKILKFLNLEAEQQNQKLAKVQRDEQKILDQHFNQDFKDI